MKKLSKYLLAVASVLSLASCGKKAEPPKEGTLYQTQVISFWAGVGSAYMTFENNEGNYVFNVNVNAGDGYSSWLTGSYILTDTLTLNATFETTDTSTYLTNATSGVDKVYEATNGVYKIEVNLPSAGTQTFKLDINNDKVGDSTISEPSNESSESKPVEKKSQLKMLSTLNESNQQAKIEMYTDNSWELSYSFYEGGEFSLLALGTWATKNNEAGEYFVEMTVTEDSGNVLSEDVYYVSIDYSDMSNMKYEVTMTLQIPVIGEVTVTLNKA